MKARTIRVFLCYSSEENELAGEIKDNLEAHGLEVFLAHEDIEPTEEWQEVIIRKLKECDIFVPIVSKNFKNSRWTDQETGIAFAEEKMIIPISHDLVPYGFIGKFQALKLGEKIPESCDKIIGIIKTKNNKLKEMLTDCFVKSFVESTSYAESNKKALLLISYEPFTEDQVNELIRGFMSNNQIHGAYEARRAIRGLFEKYFKDINQELRNKFYEYEPLSRDPSS